MNIDWNTILVIWVNIIFATLAFTQLVVYYKNIDGYINNRLVHELANIKEVLAVIEDSIDPATKMSNMNKLNEIKDQLEQISPVLENIRQSIETTNTVSNSDVLTITIELNKLIEILQSIF